MYFKLEYPEGPLYIGHNCAWRNGTSLVGSTLMTVLSVCLFLLGYQDEASFRKPVYELYAIRGDRRSMEDPFADE